MNKDKTAALREFAEIVWDTMNPVLKRDKTTEVNGIVSTLTALINEHYVPKEQHDIIVATDDRLLLENRQLKEALEKIADPIAYMQRNLKEGESLNGMMAIQISNNSEFLRTIARDALKEM